MSEDDYEYDKLEAALELSDIDPVEFCFWCPDCLEPGEICRCAWTPLEEE